jgi:23S rRNA pseudouridine955/2504/2580 synthase
VSEPSGGNGVQHVPVGSDEGDLRLDRWFKRHYPNIGHGRLAKLLRTGQIRIDGRRVKAGDRVQPGQDIRIPPLPASSKPPTTRRLKLEIDPEEAVWIQSTVLHRDDHVLAINKPPGLAVQGGTGTKRHLDAMLDCLRFDAADRPRLVHRLDKDTSGVLLLARSARAATKLTSLFRDRETLKTYWALVVGVPSPKKGHIDMALEKRGGGGAEKIVPDEDGRTAQTDYAVVEIAARRAAWLAMRPITGRTHQLRVHAAEALGTPVLGDGKYGGRNAFLGGFANKLHLHARSIVISHPVDGKTLSVTAPLPDHMAESWKFLGFDEASAENPFDDSPA